MPVPPAILGADGSESAVLETFDAQEVAEEDVELTKPDDSVTLTNSPERAENSRSETAQSTSLIDP
ncbi:MAG: hypothetical protein LBC35_05630 [Coriobacteriales bacterium]|jgi:hypothetical protein|nr:hypothetical protein [Coriobacteriales bacterium]